MVAENRAAPTSRPDADSRIRFVAVCRSRHLARTIVRRPIVAAAVSTDCYCFVVAIAADQWSYPCFVREMLVDRFVKHSVLDAANADC